MTNFVEMRTLVVGLTKRPELAALTDAAIKMATIRAHHVDFFKRDSASAVFTYAVPSGNQIFIDLTDLYTQAPLYRSALFLQGEDPSTFLPNENLEYVKTYQEFWDADNTLRSSVFTELGEGFKVRFAGPTGRAKLYYYKNPNTSVDHYSSWIADLYPDELSKWAAAIVWARSGFQEIARQSQSDIEDFKALLVESHLSSAK